MQSYDDLDTEALVDYGSERNNYTNELAEWVANLQWSDISPNLIETCKIHILDTLGVATAGSRTEHAQKAMSAVKTQGGKPQCTVFSEAWKTSAPEAAFLNGIMAHAIDFDDAHKFVHPGAAIVPAALAVAERHDSDGKAFLKGVLIGYELSIRVSLAAGLAHRKRGYHPTGTCNFFGASAAASSIVGLSKEGVESAFGIAGTQAAGLTQYRFDGSQNKHLHAGIAARGGVMAVLLAMEGFCGTRNILEGRFGFLNVLADGGESHYLSKGLGSEFYILDTDIKPYPSCRQTHTPIDLVLQLTSKYQLTPENVYDVHLETYEYALEEWLVSSTPPQTSLQAMLNIPYCLAAALADRQLSLRQFDSTKLKDNRIFELISKVRISANPEFSRRFPAEKNARLIITLADGTKLTAVSSHPYGSSADPIGFQGVKNKFINLVEPVLGLHKAKRIISTVEEMESVQHIGNFAELLEVGEN